MSAIFPFWTRKEPLYVIVYTACNCTHSVWLYTGCVFLHSACYYAVLLWGSFWRQSRSSHNNMPTNRRTKSISFSREIRFRWQRNTISQKQQIQILITAYWIDLKKSLSLLPTFKKRGRVHKKARWATNNPTKLLSTCSAKVELWRKGRWGFMMDWRRYSFQAALQPNGPSSCWSSFWTPPCWMCRGQAGP